MLETPFILYALECDGKLDTRQSKLNYFIQLLRDAADPNDASEQEAALEEADLDYLTEEEVEYVTRRLND